MRSAGSGDPRPPLADDPRFLAGLAELDRGLDGPAEANGAREAPRQTTPPRVGPVLPATPRRPLLDLFPPPESRATNPIAASAMDLPEPSGALRRAVSQAEPVTTCETFYGLHERPFSLSSDPKFLYPSSEYDRVAQQMLASIGRRDPLVVLTGDIGVGKTTLCHALVEQLDRRTLASVVADPFASIGELLKTLLIDFGVTSRSEVARGGLANATQVELEGVLRDFLTSLARLQAFAVVLVDEAQNLPVQVLRELRVLLQTDHMLQLVLVGQPSLLARVTQADDFAKLVSLRCTLAPLGSEEVAGYVRHRLSVAGDRARVNFDDAASERLYVLSCGIPRTINLLCDRALAIGCGRSARVIDRSLVDEAAADVDLARPAAPRRGLARSFGVLALLLLMGGAAGALACRKQLSALLTRWESVPAPPPRPPMSRAPAYVAPVPPET
jgi:general secretion pathway protein A